MNNSMHPILLWVFLCSLMSIACSSEPKLNLSNVGDIAFDSATDNKDFVVCDNDNIKQYYVRYSADIKAGYKGEKTALVKTVLNQYKYPKTVGEDGYLTIKFLVNCKGETDRFRVESMGFDYKAKSFSKDITSQLLRITKNLDGWIPRVGQRGNYDYYQYLCYKIKDGQIVKILP